MPGAINDTEILSDIFTKEEIIGDEHCPSDFNEGPDTKSDKAENHECNVDADVKIARQISSAAEAVAGYGKQYTDQEECRAVTATPELAQANLLGSDT